MQKTGQDHPARQIVAAHRFRGLQKMLDLGEVGIGIAVIDQLIEKLRRFPDRLLALLQAEIFGFLAQNVIEGHVSMVLPVELGDTRARLFVIDTKLFLALAFLVSALDGGAHYCISSLYVTANVYQLDVTSYNNGQ